MSVGGYAVSEGGEGYLDGSFDEPLVLFNQLSAMLLLGDVEQSDALDGCHFGCCGGKSSTVVDSDCYCDICTSELASRGMYIPTEEWS